jgi:hypothetical protein
MRKLFAIVCFVLACAGAQGATDDTNRIRLGTIPVGIFDPTNYLLGSTAATSNGFGRLYLGSQVQAAIGGGGGGGSASAVVKIDGMTNAQQVLQVRTNAAAWPTVNTNGAGGIGTNFFDFPYAGPAVNGILHSNDWQKIAPLQNANQGYVANTNTGNYGVISGGATNRSEGPFNVIAGGRRNSILGSDLTNAVAVIGGGEDNIISTNGRNKHAGITFGQSNLVDGASYGTIGGGWVNNIEGSNNVIAGGGFNTNRGSWNSTIGGGYNNRIEAQIGIATRASANVIAGGGSNWTTGDYCAISGGLRNNITNQPGAQIEGSVISGGLANYVKAGYSGIGSGVANGVSVNGGGFIAGGGNNYLDGGGGFVGGGGQNTNSGVLCSILGGLNNLITLNGDGSVILGGYNNVVDAAHAGIFGTDLTNALGGAWDMGSVQATKLTVDGTTTTVRGALVGPGGASIGAMTNVTQVTSNWLRFPSTTSGFWEWKRALAAASQSNSFTMNVVNPAPGQVLMIDSVTTSAGSNNVAFTNKAVAGSGDVTAAANFGTDNRLIRSDGSGKGVQSSGVTLDDSDNMTIPGSLTVSSTSTYNGAATFTANVNLQKDLSVLAGSTIKLGSPTFTSNELTHLGPVAYLMTNISGTDIDWALSSARKKTLTGNTTFTFSNLADDRHVYVYLSQDATGTRTVTWPSATWLGHTNQSGTLNFGGVNTNGNFQTVLHFWRDSGVVFGEVVTTAPSRFDVDWSTGTVPSSDIAARVSDETGFGKLVFADGPALGTFGSSTNAGLNFVYLTNNQAFVLTTQLVATNSTVNSNLTMNVNLGVLDLVLTNNISLTNFANLEASTSKTVTWHLYPTLANRTVVWPTPGAPGNAVYWRTNANSPMWTTLTNGNMYVLSCEWRNTNCWASISEWK